MADKKEPAAKGLTPPPPSKLPLIAALLNTVAVMGVGAAIVYTKLLYQRPTITESSERARLAKAHAKPEAPSNPGLVDFKTVTVNIEASPAQPLPADGTPEQLQGKLHYVTVGFALEVRDVAQTEKIETLRSILMDAVLGVLGRKDFQELSTVQGRYVLRTQIIDTANELVKKLSGAEAAASDAFVTNVFFTQFIVQ